MSGLERMLEPLCLGPACLPGLAAAIAAGLLLLICRIAGEAALRQLDREIAEERRRREGR
jgi:hypothetical protein